MESATYPDPGVIDIVNAQFKATRVSIKDPPEALREVLPYVKALWAPMFLFVDRRGIELRRVVGFLPPREFMAELEFVLAMHDHLRGRFSEASQRFHQVADRAPDGYLAPEALFWAGAAAYRRDQRDMHVLRDEWDLLRRKYPQSTWSQRASVIDDARLDQGSMTKEQPCFSKPSDS